MKFHFVFLCLLGSSCGLAAANEEALFLLQAQATKLYARQVENSEESVEMTSGNAVVDGSDSRASAEDVAVAAILKQRIADVQPARDKKCRRRCHYHPRFDCRLVCKVSCQKRNLNWAPKCGQKRTTTTTTAAPTCLDLTGVYTANDGETVTMTQTICKGSTSRNTAYTVEGNTATRNDGYTGKVVKNNGLFTITWTNDAADGSGQEIYTQQCLDLRGSYTANDGETVTMTQNNCQGSTSRNTAYNVEGTVATRNDGYTGKVVKNNGYFTITWTNQAADGAGQEIYRQQCLDLTGSYTANDGETVTMSQTNCKGTTSRNTVYTVEANVPTRNDGYVGKVVKNDGLFTITWNNQAADGSGQEVYNQQAA